MYSQFFVHTDSETLASKVISQQLLSIGLSTKT
jgi:hypothetical protein